MGWPDRAGGQPLRTQVWPPLPSPSEDRILVTKSPCVCLVQLVCTSPLASRRRRLLTRRLVAAPPDESPPRPQTPIFDLIDRTLLTETTTTSRIATASK